MCRLDLCVLLLKLKVKKRLYPNDTSTSTYIYALWWLVNCSQVATCSQAETNHVHCVVLPYVY